MQRSFLSSISGVLLIALAGCAPASSPGAVDQPGPRPAVPQTMVWGTPVEMPTLHPFVTAVGTQRRYDIYDMLIALDSTGKPGPMIGTSWRLVDDRTWEFKIREDVKFHDGAPLTADDVVFSYNIAKDTSRKYSITTRAKTFANATVIDKATVQIRTIDPDPLFLRRAALISLLPKAYLERVGDDQFGQAPIGSGPFKVREFKVSDHLYLTGVMDHAFRKPTLTDVTIRFLPDPSSRVNGLRTGEIDFTESFPVASLDQVGPAGLKSLPIDFGTSRGYWVDTVQGNAPTTQITRDKRVRQALNYAIDKEAINKTFFNGMTKVEQCQPIQAETFGYNPRLKAYPYDPAKARQLLQEAGAIGAKITIDSLKSQDQGEPMNLFVQSQLNAVGLDVSLNVLGEYAVFRDKFYGDQPRSTLFPPQLNNQPLLDADGALTWFASDQTPGARHYDNPEFQQYYKASLVEMNETKRLDLLQKALDVFCDDPPYLFTVQALTTWVYRPIFDSVEKRIDREPRLDLFRRIQ